MAKRNERKRLSDGVLPATTAGGTKRVLATDEKKADAAKSLRQPNERDESADSTAAKTSGRMKHAHDDVQSGQQDTDCRNRVSETLPDQPNTPENAKR